VIARRASGRVADQGMTAGRKDDGLTVGHASGDGLRPIGRAERIVSGTHRQNRADDLFNRIRLVPGGSLHVELHSSGAQAYWQKVFQNLLNARLLAGLGASHNVGVRAKHHLGHCAGTYHAHMAPHSTSVRGTPRSIHVTSFNS
jgi:hypothetical protein